MVPPFDMNNIKLKYKFKYNILFEEDFNLSDCNVCGKMSKIQIYEYDDFGSCKHVINCSIGCTCFCITEIDVIGSNESMEKAINFIEEFIVKIKECAEEWNIINNRPLKIEYKQQKLLS